MTERGDLPDTTILEPDALRGELEYVQDAEIVDEGPSWEELTSEWAEGARHELVGQLRQARAAAAVMRTYGTGAMKKFAGEVGASKSKVYDYAKVWAVYGHLFEDGELPASFQTRGISHMVAALKDPEPVRMLETSEDEDLSVRQIEERTQDREQAEHGGPERVEAKECPSCGADGKFWQRVPVEATSPVQDEELNAAADRLAEKIAHLKTQSRAQRPKWSIGDMDDVERVLEELR